MLSALRHRGLRWTAAIYFFDIVVEWFAMVALMVLVYDHTSSATLTAALLVCKQVLPGMLIPVMGNALDRVRIERALGVALGVQAGAFALLAEYGYGLELFVLAAVVGTAGGTARSLLRAGLARRLRGDALASGNAVLNLSVGFSGFVGPALAAAAVGAWGAQSALLIAATGIAVLSASSTLMPRAPGSAPSTTQEMPDGDRSDPVNHVDSRVPIGRMLIVAGVVACVFAMDQPALLAFSEESIGAGVEGFGAMVLAWGLGIAVGSVVFTRLVGWSMLHVYAFATLLAGVALIGMSASPTLWVAVAFAVIGGVGNGMDWVAVVTLVQRATPRGKEAWAATRLEGVCTAAPGLGFLIGGLIADLASPRAALLAPGLLGCGVVVSVALLLRARGWSSRPTNSFIPSIPGGSA